MTQLSTIINDINILKIIELENDIKSASILNDTELEINFIEIVSS